MKNKPPKIAEKILSQAALYRDRSFLLADMEEIYFIILEEKGKKEADRWYRQQTLKSLPHLLFSLIYWSISMFRNYIIIALRNIRRKAGYSFINIAGLALALACSLLIFFHIDHELSFENIYPDADNIYRIQIDSKFGDTWREWATGPFPVGPMLTEQYPEVTGFTRISNRVREQILSTTDNSGLKQEFSETGGLYADPSFPGMFDIYFIRGNRDEALKNVNSMVITEKMAKKYFGEENPTGKTISDLNSGSVYNITGVVTNPPSNTHIQFDFLISLKTFTSQLTGEWKDATESRTWKAVFTYIKLRDKESLAGMRVKMPQFIESFHEENPNRVEIFNLQPIKDIHLHSKVDGELSVNSDITYIYIFGATAIFLILIASFNFVNISLALSLKRFLEVGMRKVTGAQGVHIKFQFFTETFLLTFFSAALSLVLIWLFIPLFNELSGNNFSSGIIFSAGPLIIVGGLVILITLLAGLYPAIYISRVNPVEALGNFKTPGTSVAVVRKGLVILQFVISVFMIFGAITIYQQLQFFMESDMGFKKEKLVAVDLFTSRVKNRAEKLETIKAELLSYNRISFVTLATNLPGDRFSIEHVVPEGMERNKLPTVKVIRTDEDYLKTMGIKLAEGKDFHKSESDISQLIINEAARSALGLKSAQNIKCRTYFNEAEIVGMVNDFHFESLHNNIEPMFLEYKPNWCSKIFIRYEGNDEKELLGFINESLKKAIPGHFFSYTFIDDYINRHYSDEKNAVDIFRAFALLSIIVSCLGLLGLAYYSVENRRREVGIRKTLGASTGELNILLSTDFIKWIIIAIVIALPAAYFFMSGWLDTFPNKISIGVDIFILSAVIVLLTGFITVTIQTIRGALTNPVDVLKHE